MYKLTQTRLLEQILEKKSLGNFNFMQVKCFSPSPEEHTAFNLLSPMILTGEKRANYLKALLPFNKRASRAIGRCFAARGRTTSHTWSCYHLFIHLSVAFKGTSQNVILHLATTALPARSHLKCQGWEWPVQTVPLLEIMQSWPGVKCHKIPIVSKHGLQRKDLLPALGASDSFAILFCLALAKTMESHGYVLLSDKVGALRWNSAQNKRFS